MELSVTTQSPESCNESTQQMLYSSPTHNATENIENS